MSWGLPKLPGFTFQDITKTQFNLNTSLKFSQGYRFPDMTVHGSGGTPTDADSNAFSLAEDSVNYDPSLTYGRVKQQPLPAVIPHWVHYDKRCLNFTAFFKQPVYDNPDENFRVRMVNLIYFLEDDTLTVMEPRVRNSGIWQGKMVRRGKIPKNDLGEYWHWKDLDVGKDICIYGKVFHTVSCDLYTKLLEIARKSQRQTTLTVSHLSFEHKDRVLSLLALNTHLDSTHGHKDRGGLTVAIVAHKIFTKNTDTPDGILHQKLSALLQNLFKKVQDDFV